MASCRLLPCSIGITRNLQESGIGRPPPSATAGLRYTLLSWPTVQSAVTAAVDTAFGCRLRRGPDVRQYHGIFAAEHKTGDRTHTLGRRAGRAGRNGARPAPAQRRRLHQRQQPLRRLRPQDHREDRGVVRGSDSVIHCCRDCITDMIQAPFHYEIDYGRIFSCGGCTVRPVRKQGAWRNGVRRRA